MVNVMFYVVSWANMIMPNNKYLLTAFFALALMCTNAQTSYTWRAVSTNSDWATTSNWTPAGSPVAGDNVVIVASNNVPDYNGVALNNFTLTSGAINLAGNTLTVNGNAVFTAGNVTNGNVLCQGTATTFTNATFAGKVTSSTNNVLINGGVFNDSVSITKNGTTDQNMLGNATFNAPLNLRITNSGRMWIKGGMTLNGVTSIYNSGLDYFILDSVSANNYNNDLHLTIAGNTVGDIRIGFTAPTTINGDVYVNSLSGTGDIFFGDGLSASVTLAAGKRIIVGSGGFNSGNIWLKRFTQVGATDQSLLLSGTAAMRLGPSSVFNGKVDFVSPQLYLDGCRFEDSTWLTKSGVSTNVGAGGNTFNGVTFITKSGSGLLRTNGGNVSNNKLFINNSSSTGVILALVNGDTYNGDVEVNKTAAGTVHMAYAGTNVFGGNVTVNNSAAGNILFCELANASASIAGDVTLTNTAAGNISFCSAANTSVAFGGNLELNNTSTGSLTFCPNATASATMAAGKTISIGGLGFTGGSLLLPRFNQSGTAATSLTLTGTTAAVTVGPNTVFGGKVSLIAPQVTLSGATFGDSAFIQKTGAATNTGAGNNVFNGVTTVSKIGSGILRTNGGNTFNDKLFINNASSTEIVLSFVNGDTYNGDVDISKSSNGTVRMAYAGTNVFGGDVIVSNSATGSVLFCELANASASIAGDVTLSNSATGSISFCSAANTSVAFGGNLELNNTAAGSLTFCPNATASATMAAGKTISIGGLGFTGGSLLLPRFNQSGAAATSLTLTGATAAVTVGPNTVFGGKVSLIAPQIILSGATFPDTTFIQKSGIGNNTGLGNNIFNGYTTISKTSGAGAGQLRTNGNNTFNDKLRVENASSSDLLLGLTSRNIYNHDVTAVNSGASSIRLAYTGNNIFGGKINVINSAAGTVPFCEAANSSASVADSVILSNTSSGSITFSVAANSNTVFDENIIVSNTASGNIGFCSNGTAAASLAAGKTILVGSSGFSAGSLLLPRFSQLGTAPIALNFSGTATISVGPKTVFGGKASFIAPQILLGGATFADSAYIQKTGATANISAGGNKFNGVASIINSSSVAMYMGGASADSFFNKLNLLNSGGSVLYLAHSHTNKTSYFADSVIVFNTSSAAGNPGVRFGESNNTNAFFDGVVVVNNNGTGATNFIRFQNGTGSFTFNGDVHLNNSGTGNATAIHMNYSGTANYNGNIYVSRASGNGTYFGNNNGSSTLASNQNLFLGSSGYTGGNLLLRNFQQSGNRNAVNLNLAGTTIFTVRNSTFDGPVVVSSPQIYINNNTFNHNVEFTKTGSTVNNSAGGNIFMGTTSITNASTFDFRMANTTGDTYNGDAIFTRNASGALDLANNSSVSFSRNITTAGSGAVLFGSGGVNGRIILTGGSSQVFSGNALQIPVVSRMTMNKTVGTSLTLNLPVYIAAAGNLTMSSGLINTDSLNVLTLLNGATANLGSPSSFVNGFLNHQMTATTTRLLTFPIGRDSVYRPVELTVTHSSNIGYTYSSLLFNQSAVELEKAFPSTIDRVSDFRYWRIKRYLSSTMVPSNANLSGNQIVTLHYFASDSVQDATNLRIVKDSAGTANWINIGGVGTANYQGTITSTSNPSAFNSFSHFTLGNATGGGNTLPVTLTSIKASGIVNTIKVEWVTTAEINNKGFEVERSEDGTNFSNIGWVDGNGTTAETVEYTFDDTKVIANKIYYYRLRQVDFDGASEYTPIVSAKITDASSREIVWSRFIPNPAAADANLVINANAEGKADVTILNLAGAVVHQSAYNLYHGLNNLMLDLSQLPSGNYITKIDLNGGSTTLKLMRE